MRSMVNIVFKSVLSSLVVASVFFIKIPDKAIPTHQPVQMVEPFVREGVYVQKKLYTFEESRKYLNRNLHRYGIQPIEVTIQNNTASTYILSENGVEAENSSGKQVANRVTMHGVPRSIALKVAGMFFWPLMIPSAIDSIISLKSNLQMRAEYHAKSIKREGELILPYSTVHRVLFVPHGKVEKTLTLHLKDAKSHHYLTLNS